MVSFYGNLREILQQEPGKPKPPSLDPLRWEPASVTTPLYYFGRQQLDNNSATCKTNLLKQPRKAHPYSRNIPEIVERSLYNMT